MVQPLLYIVEVTTSYMFLRLGNWSKISKHKKLAKAGIRSSTGTFNLHIHVYNSLKKNYILKNNGINKQ